MPDETATILRAIESRLSNLEVRMAIAENLVSVAGTERKQEQTQTRENNIPTRTALVESNIKGLYRLMWVILAAILAGFVANVLQIVSHGGGK